MSMQAMEVRDESKLISCRCGATVCVALNYADGSRPISVQAFHADDCTDGQWVEYPGMGGVITGNVLQRMVVPVESAAEFRDRLVGLVDSGECDPKCMFASPESLRICDCKCEGQHHGAMRWVDQ